jgi:hypothetical protein
VLPRSRAPFRQLRGSRPALHAGHDNHSPAAVSNLPLPIVEACRVRQPSSFPRFDLPLTFWRDAARAWEIALTAPQVIALRSARLAAAGATPSRRDMNECARMGAEKWQAFNQAWAAMAMEAWLYPLVLASALARGRSALPMPNLYGRGLAPVHRKVRANHRRLSRR